MKKAIIIVKCKKKKQQQQLNNNNKKQKKTHLSYAAFKGKRKISNHYKVNCRLTVVLKKFHS